MSETQPLYENATLNIHRFACLCTFTVVKILFKPYLKRTDNTVSYFKLYVVYCLPNNVMIKQTHMVTLFNTGTKKIMKNQNFPFFTFIKIKTRKSGPHEIYLDT